jgi:hypothetical protein
VDHWLLGDWAQVLVCGRVAALSDLNAFEKCLLIQTLTSYGMHERALKIAETMHL